MTNINVCELGVVPAVPRPHDAPQLDVLAELYLAPALDPRREQLRARQLPEHPDLRLVSKVGQGLGTLYGIMYNSEMRH